MAWQDSLYTLILTSRASTLNPGIRCPLDEQKKSTQWVSQPENRVIIHMVIVNSELTVMHIYI